jgi:hypothetical protein
MYIQVIHFRCFENNVVINTFSTRQEAVDCIIERIENKFAQQKPSFLHRILYATVLPNPQSSHKEIIENSRKILNVINHLNYTIEGNMYHLQAVSIQIQQTPTAPRGYGR